MHSKIVVISWWSNCLALACLHRLVELVDARQIYVVQVGKPIQQRELFRINLPTRVTELGYPPGGPAEHSRVLEWVSLHALRSEAGLWFIDHDVIIEADIATDHNVSGLGCLETWLQAADQFLGREKLSLFLPSLNANPAITQPAFWLSPARWPDFTPAFDPIPFEARLESCRPDVYRHDGNLRMPVKDTLIAAREALMQRGLVGFFPLNPLDGQASNLQPFPPHIHLGGLSLFSGPVLPPQFTEWMERTVKGFNEFYEHCPAEWLAIEDPVLLERLAEFSKALHV
ncbi:MAG TPA: hypothetical protein VJ436_00510 [Anaerolineales bacterium]|nr:hypothetical protein [Anaerolineales bacterium]